MPCLVELTPRPPQRSGAELTAKARGDPQEKTSALARRIQFHFARRVKWRRFLTTETFPRALSPLLCGIVGCSSRPCLAIAKCAPTICRSKHAKCLRHVTSDIL